MERSTITWFVLISLFCFSMQTEMLNNDCPPQCDCRKVHIDGNQRDKTTCKFNVASAQEIISKINKGTRWLEIICRLPSESESIFSSELMKTFINIERMDITNCFFSIENKWVIETFPSGLQNLTFYSNFRTKYTFKWSQLLGDIEHLKIQLNNRGSSTRDNFCGSDSLKSLNISNTPIFSLNYIGLTCPFSSQHCDICLLNLHDLDISGGFLKQLDVRLSMILPNLRKLDASRNNVHKIEPYTFSNSQNLEEIDLSSNYINQLSEGAFQKMPSLKYLSLAHNELDIITGTLFSQENTSPPGSNLEKLDLNNNKITFISEKVFAGFKKISQISLRGNNLKNIGPWMTNLPLVNVDLSINKLERANVEMFPHKLERLNLSSNLIDQVPSDVFNTLNKLIEVDLSFNLLSHFPPSLIESQIKTIKHINLKGNPFHSCYCISTTSKHTQPLLCKNGQINEQGILFPFSNYLYRKDIVCNYKEDCSKSVCKCCQLRSGCQCRTFCPKGCLCMRNFDSSQHILKCPNANMKSFPDMLPKHLTELDLSGNPINVIHSIDLHNLIRLKTLHLNSTMLDTIPERAFDELKYLENLNLASNNLLSMNFLDLNKLTSLKSLYLNNNEFGKIDIFEIDRAFGNNLSRVSLSANPWECDCEFGQQFQAWIQRRNSKIIDKDSIRCKNIILKKSDSLAMKKTLLDIDFSSCGDINPRSLLPETVRGIPKKKVLDDLSENKTVYIIIGVLASVFVLLMVAGVFLYVGKRNMSKNVKKQKGSLVFENKMGRTWRKTGNANGESGDVNQHHYMRRNSTSTISECRAGLGIVPNIYE